MRIKLDENLPLILRDNLAALGHDVDTVRDEGLAGSADGAIWIASQRENRFLITQDMDFSDLRKYAPGTHQGVLLVRLRIPGARALSGRVSQVFRDEAVESWQGGIVVLTDRKVRARLAARP